MSTLPSRVLVANALERLASDIKAGVVKTPLETQRHLRKLAASLPSQRVNRVGSKKIEDILDEAEIGFDPYDIGEKMMHWHVGQGDPLYSISSTLKDGEVPSKSLLEKAENNVDRLLKTTKGKDKKELEEISDAIGQILRAM